MGRMSLNFWSTPAHAILMMLAGWIHREQDAVVAYQREKIRALREMLGGKRLRFTDAQRRRLALLRLMTFWSAAVAIATLPNSSP